MNPKGGKVESGLTALIAAQYCPVVTQGPVNGGGNTSQRASNTSQLYQPTAPVQMVQLSPHLPILNGLVSEENVVNPLS